MTLWQSRDRPVLRYLADNPPQHGYLWTQSRSHQPHEGLPELTQADFHRSVETLEDAGYVTCARNERDGSGIVGWQDFLVTIEGSKALGDWPHFDLFARPETLASILDRLADLAPTPEEAENRRSAAGLIRRLATTGGREAVTGALAVAIRTGLKLLTS